MWVDAMEQALQGKLLLDSVDESPDIRGDSVQVLWELSAPIFSSMQHIGGAGKVPEGNLSSTG